MASRSHISEPSDPYLPGNVERCTGYVKMPQEYTLPCPLVESCLRSLCPDVDSWVGMIDQTECEVDGKFKKYIEYNP